MRGWRNNLLVTGIWMAYLVVATMLLPDWLLAASVAYIFAGL